MLGGAATLLLTKLLLPPSLAAAGPPGSAQAAGSARKKLRVYIRSEHYHQQVRHATRALPGAAQRFAHAAIHLLLVLCALNAR